MRHLLIFLGIVLIDIPAMMLRGFVLSRLWEWFLTPLGAPSIGVAQAIGISFLVGMFTAFLAKTSDVKNPDQEWYVAAIGAVLGSLLISLTFWGLGAIVHTFM